MAPTTVTDDCARTIASGWHGGASSALYSFVSTGALVYNVLSEITECAEYIREHPQTYDPHHWTEIEMLADYALAYYPRGPVEGWANRWDDCCS